MHIAHSTDASQSDTLEDAIIAPFTHRGRIFAPSIRAFEESGRILADLARRDGVTIATKRSLVNDTLLAASCREAGVMLVTRDGDHARIARWLKGFRHAAPWPGSDNQGATEPPPVKARERTPRAVERTVRPPPSDANAA